MSEELKAMVERIRKRHEKRIAEGMVGGVQEWFEIATLLRYISELEAYAADAHKDAVVNKDTADKLEKEQAEVWNEGMEAGYNRRMFDTPIVNPYRFPEKTSTLNFARPCTLCDGLIHVINGERQRHQCKIPKP